MTEPHDWRAMLRAARKALKLDQAELAERLGMSRDTLRAYENGRRRPTRARLIRILDHMKLSQLERNRILTGAGFAADGAELGLASEKRQMSFEQAVAEVHAATWPAWIVGDMVEIIAANELGKAMWGFDPADPKLTAIDRNVMSYATTLLPKRIVNWSEMAVGQIAAWKAHFRGGEDIDAPSVYFAPVLDRILAGDPAYVDRFVELWRSVPAYYPPGWRWQYPMVWQEPDLPAMRFQGTSWVVNEVDGLDIDDWYPLDAQTWDAVEQLRARIEAGRGATSTS